MLFFKTVKRDQAAIQAAIEAVREARAATNAALAAVDAATAALAANGQSSQPEFGASPKWKASPTPQCPSRTSRIARKIRGIRSPISSRR